MKKIILVGLIFLLATSSCKKVLNIDSVRTVGEINMWNKLEDSRAGLLGVYALTRAALIDNNAHWLYGDVRSGDFTSPGRQDLKAIINNFLNASYTSVDALSNWTRWYAVVNASNIFMERIGDVKKADPRYTTNNMMLDVAQARFLRAFAYFYMVRIWGDVPFIITSHDGQFENKARESKDKILEWAKQEMVMAAKDLPYIYSADDPQQPGLYYNEDVNRWGGALVRKSTAYAILAHVTAWQGDYPGTAAYTKIFMDNYGKSRINWASTNYLTSANGFFNNKNNSQLLGFNSDYGHGDGSTTGHIEELTLALPVVTKILPDIFMVKDSILSIFNERDDQRFSLDTVGNPLFESYFTNYNGKYPIFSKVKSIQGGGSDPNFRYFSSAVIFTRLEDIALLRAEALAVLGEKVGATEALNLVRTQRGLKEYSAEANGDIIDAIFKERRRELMGEGHRWYDIIRYNKIKQSNPVMLNMINTGGIYWPISRKLLNQNSLLTQNSYWK